MVFSIFHFPPPNIFKFFKEISGSFSEGSAADLVLNDGYGQKWKTKKELIVLVDGAMNAL